MNFFEVAILFVKMFYKVIFKGAVILSIWKYKRKHLFCKCTVKVDYIKS